jgi:hypothetical protein
MIAFDAFNTGLSGLALKPDIVPSFALSPSTIAQRNFFAEKQTLVYLNE